MREPERHSRAWFIKHSREARKNVLALAKLFPGCFTPDGRPIIGEARLPNRAAMTTQVSPPAATGEQA